MQAGNKLSKFIVLVVASLFYFGKNYTTVIEKKSYLQCSYSVKSKLVMALAGSI